MESDAKVHLIHHVHHRPTSTHVHGVPDVSIREYIWRDCINTRGYTYLGDQYVPIHSVCNMSLYSTISAVVVGALWILILAPVDQIHGTPTGAPIAACESMTPGHGYDAQNSTSPFKTEIPAGMIAYMDDPVHLELRSLTSGTYFKGFLIMAFNKDDTSANPKPIGTFKLIEGSDGQLMDCSGKVSNAVTHTNNVVKNLVRIDWQPPKYYMGTAIFRTTFVQDVSTYWVKTESISVTFVMPDGSTHDPMMTVKANKV